MIKHVLVLAIVAAVAGCASSPSSSQTLRRALTFHASFDQGPDADFALGDPRLFTASAMNKRDAAMPGLRAGDATVIATGAGRFGSALRFAKKQAPVVFFQAEKNFAYATNRWNGSVSFWLQTDPATELEKGFCDPIQITPRAWNDAAFFVEFEKRETVPFRLGVYADFKTWNPANRKWEEIPAADKPLLTVAQPPFRAGKWTHVVFTFEDFNTGQADGIAKLYLDGEFQGAIPARTQTFTWDIKNTAAMLGLSYLGLFDELSFFNRALSVAEVRSLHALPEGVRSLR